MKKNQSHEISIIKSVLADELFNPSPTLDHKKDILHLNDTSIKKIISFILKKDYKGLEVFFNKYQVKNYKLNYNAGDGDFDIFYQSFLRDFDINSYKKFMEILSNNISNFPRELSINDIYRAIINNPNKNSFSFLSNVENIIGLSSPTSNKPHELDIKSLNSIYYFIYRHSLLKVCVNYPHNMNKIKDDLKILDFLEEKSCHYDFKNNFFDIQDYNFFYELLKIKNADGFNYIKKYFPENINWGDQSSRAILNFTRSSLNYIDDFYNFLNTCESIPEVKNNINKINERAVKERNEHLDNLNNALSSSPAKPVHDKDSKINLLENLHKSSLYMFDNVLFRKNQWSLIEKVPPSNIVDALISFNNPLMLDLIKNPKSRDLILNRLDDDVLFTNWILSSNARTIETVFLFKDFSNWKDANNNNAIHFFAMMSTAFNQEDVDIHSFDLQNIVKKNMKLFYQKNDFGFTPIDILNSTPSYHKDKIRELMVYIDKFKLKEQVKLSSYSTQIKRPKKI